MDGIGTNWQKWPTIVNGDGEGSGPCYPLYSGETFYQGDAIFYLPQGSYLMIGKYEGDGQLPAPPHSDYIGRLVNVSPGVDDHQNFQVIKKCDKRNSFGQEQKIHRIGPAGDRTGVCGVELGYRTLSLCFDSVGDWDVTTSVAPPEGFVSDYDSLNATVSSELKAVQFTITDVGSKWIPTKVTHKIKHKKQKK